ncbi:glycoside hydrolase, partial [Flavobacteriaceae bacterium]|nr:glycoside hydrolase [Flavobacteriaceae bacterium]
MRIVFTFYLIFSLGACSMSTYKEPKINGVSFVASRDSIFEKHVTPVMRINANYAAIMPYGFIRSSDEPNIIYNTSRQWFGESKSGAEQYIQELSRHNIRIMMKPHLWIRGEFTGHMTMTSDKNWEQLKQSYTTFIMEYAMLAESTKTEIFCIGTELEAFVKYDSKYWLGLIKKIKSVYSGKLTYAANWDEYYKIPFWDQLDYIGIDAYFPVSNAQTPLVEECLNAWQLHKKAIKT